VNEFKHTEEFVIKMKYFKKAWKITYFKYLAQKMYQTKTPSQGLVSLAPFEIEITRVGMAISTMLQNLSVGNNKLSPVV